jgi:hypothetical protein
MFGVTGRRLACVACTMGDVAAVVAGALVR